MLDEGEGVLLKDNYRIISRLALDDHSLHMNWHLVTTREIFFGLETAKYLLMND